MTKHTPTPWVIDECGNIMFGYNQLLLRGITLPSGNHPRADEAQANAEFIVRACNNHNALVDALNDALNFISENHNNNHPLLVQGEKALAKAKGE